MSQELLFKVAIVVIGVIAATVAEIRLRRHMRDSVRRRDEFRRLYDAQRPR